MTTARAPKRIWLVAPEVPARHVYGTAPLVERLANGLRARGLEVAIGEARRGHVSMPATWAPDVIHAIDLWRVSPYARMCADLHPHAHLVATAASSSLDCDLADPTTLAVAKKLVDRAKAITAQHAQARKLVSRTFPERPIPELVEPAVDLKETKSAGDIATVRMKDIPQNERVFLMLAGFTQRTEPRLALEAVAHLRGEGVPCNLAYAGPCLEGRTRVFMKAAASMYGFVHDLGEVPHAGVPTLLRRATALLQTSVGESVPDAILEALSLGVPVIARERDGVRGLIRDGREGLLYRDEAGLGRALKLLATDEEARSVLSVRGRETAEARFNPARELDDYLAIYQAAGSIPANQE